MTKTTAISNKAVEAGDGQSVYVTFPGSPGCKFCAVDIKNSDTGRCIDPLCGVIVHSWIETPVYVAFEPEYEHSDALPALLTIFEHAARVEPGIDCGEVQLMAEAGPILVQTKYAEEVTALLNELFIEQVHGEGTEYLAHI